jgi:integrase
MIQRRPINRIFLGLRDSALIAMMVFSLARIGAVIQMKVGDYFVQGRRRWMRLHEKGGKEHDVPCHHRLDQCLHDYINLSKILPQFLGFRRSLIHHYPDDQFVSLRNECWKTETKAGEKFH